MIANGKRTPAVAYLRMSTDRQDKSIGEQRVEVEKLAAAEGYRIIRTYTDEGISGDNTAKRVEFQRMMADAAGGEFDAILCWDQDRFGRFNSLEAGYYVYPLMQRGVELVTCAQGRIDWGEFSGRLLYAIAQEGKNQFLVDMSRNVCRGLLASAQQGKWVGGRPPYGYEIGDDGRLVLGNPAHVAVVRRIYSMRLEGMGYRLIAIRLNTDGVPSPRDGQWGHTAVRRIVEREVYRGVIVVGAADRGGKYYTVCDGEITKANGRRARVPQTIEGTHEAIIDDATWHAVQAVSVKRPKPHGRRTSDGAPLAGLVWCGRCGALMYSKRRDGKYVCSTYSRGGDCGCCTVPQGALLTVVANVIREKVLHGSVERLERAVASALKEKRQKGRADDVEAAQRRLTRLDGQIKRARRRLLTVDDSLVAELERELLSMKRERAQLAAEISKPEPKAGASAREIAEGVWKLDEVLRGGSPSKVRAGLSGIVERITLHFEPDRKHKRGQTFRLARGEITFCTQRCRKPSRAV